MIDYKKSTAPGSTITLDLQTLDHSTENIYESVIITAKRANQISAEIKQELSRKLEEFAYYTDNLEEVFENREQIEISRFYERLPKPGLMALQEFLDDKIYFRLPEKQESEDVKEEEK